MLTFFRRIRKGLLEGGRTSKYLLYAVGEIALVVIGILIALQINNWNERSKERILEREILVSMRTGLDHDRSDLESDRELNRVSLKSQEILIYWLNSPIPYPDSLCHHFARSNGFTSFISDDSAFETLKTNGLGLISNDSLQNKISSIYEFKYDFLLEVEGVFNGFIKSLLVLNSKYFSDAPWDINGLQLFGCMPPNNTEEIREANDYLYHLKLCTELRKHLMNTMEDTLRGLNNLIEMIDAELED